MLSYCKIILEKMSFDATLLNKEYKKCLSYLSHREVAVFNRWVRKQPFYHRLTRKPLIVQTENSK